MFRISVLAVLAVLAPFAAGLVSAEREAMVMGGEGSNNSGLTVRYKTMVAPPGASLSGGGGFWMDANTVHRYMVDPRNGTYFGYDLVIGAGDGTTGRLATFRALTMTERALEHHIGTSLKPLLLARFPAPQVVRDGDVIAVDLMVSPDGKQRLTDYVEILSNAPEPAAATTTAEPRNFTVDDGPVSFDPARITIWIDGQRYLRTSGFTGKPGSTFWMTLPGQGRYILSLTPHDGFVESGAIRDNVVSFRAEGRQYEFRFMKPVAGAGKAWKLYMFHDAAYEPPAARRDILSTGIDRLENLLPAR